MPAPDPPRAPAPPAADGGLARRWAVAAAVAVTALAVGAFWRRYAFLASSPYPTGVDGYFYAIQLRALLEDGRLYYDSAPLALWLMTPAAALTDPITGAKLGAALGTSLLVVPAYLLGRRIGGGRAAGFLAAALVAASAQGFYLTTEFVKTGVGVTLAAGFWAALAGALTRPRPAPLAVAAGLLLATALTHKLALALALAGAGPPLVLAWRAAPGPRRRALAIAAGAGAALVALALVVTGQLRGSDLAALGGLFRAEADWTLPALRPAPDFVLRFGHEVALGGALGLATLIGLATLRRRAGAGEGEGGARGQGPDGASAPPRAAAGTRAGEARNPTVDQAFVVGPALVGVFLAVPWLDPSDPEGLVFRLRLLAFLPLALAAAWLVGQLTRRWSAAARAALVVGFALGWFASRPAHPAEGVVRVHPALAQATEAARGLVPAGHVVIAPQRQLVFMTTWYTGVPARLRPEPVPPERRWRLVPGRLLHPQLRREIDRFWDEQAAAGPPAGLGPPRALHAGHRHGLVLMPEATFQYLLERVDPAVRAHYERWSAR